MSHQVHIKTEVNMTSKRASRVREYAAARLRGAQPDDAVVDRLTVSLKERDHFRLVYLAERMGATQGQLLTDLLTAAIDDAMAVLEPGTWEEYLENWREHNPISNELEEHVLPDLYQQGRESFGQALDEAYRHWIQGGKKPPRSPGERGDDDRSVTLTPASGRNGEQ
jgi:hypothetical protein